MLDTLYVATNAIPDTLKLVLESSNNSNFVFQFITLLIALAAIIIAPCVQLRIAKMNRKSDKEKIDNDLYKEIDLVWLDKFKVLISKYLSLMENISKEIREKQKPIESKQILSAYFFNRSQIVLHISSMSYNQTDLVNEINSDLTDLLNIKETEKQIEFITKHIDNIVKFSHDVINDVLLKKRDHKSLFGF